MCVHGRYSECYGDCLCGLNGCYVARAGCDSSECSVARSSSQSRSALRIEPQDTIPLPRASLDYPGIPGPEMRVGVLMSLKAIPTSQFRDIRLPHVNFRP